MSAAWVVPSIDPHFRKRLLSTLSASVRRHLLVVDNTTLNRGVAASWNTGIDMAAAQGAEWLVICSESMRFGAAGGADLEAVLEGRAAGWATGRCDRSCTPVAATGEGFCANGYGWHLVALHMDLVAEVGRFDERFWPAWYEDADYTYRIAQTKWADSHASVGELDAHLVACEHSLNAKLVTRSPWDVLPLYLAKHGGPPGHEIR